MENGLSFGFSLIFVSLTNVDGKTGFSSLGFSFIFVSLINVDGKTGFSSITLLISTTLFLLLSLLFIFPAKFCCALFTSLFIIFIGFCCSFKF